MASVACWWEQTDEGITGNVRSEKNEEPKITVPGLSEASWEIPRLKEAFPEKEEEERLECPICFEAFDAFGNAPHVLWCGHTLCKSCVLGLQRAVLKFPKLRPIALPFFVSCPWCSVLSLRFAFNGNLKFPTKNYYLLWMVDGSISSRVSCTTSKPQVMVSCTRSNHQIKSLLESNHRQERPELTQEEGIAVLTGFNALPFLGSFCMSLSRFSLSPAKLVFRLALLLLFVALFANQVNTFFLALYAFVAISAEFILLDLCFPEIGLPV